MNYILFVVMFAESFLLYSLLRWFDVESTRRLAKRLDLPKHEMNPTITWLAKKLGLEGAFRLTWLVTASTVGIVDAFLNQLFPFAVPVFALILGFSHLLAAAHNTHLSHILDREGVEEFEKQHVERMREIANARWKRKLVLVFWNDPTLLLMSIMAVPLTYALTYALVVTDVFIRIDASNKLLIGPFNTAVAFMYAAVLIYPAIAVGPLIVSRRFSNKDRATNDQPSTDEESASAIVEMPVSVVERALSSAKEKGVKTVRIVVPSSGADQ